jgi:hypothetical protein
MRQQLPEILGDYFPIEFERLKLQLKFNRVEVLRVPNF